MSRMNMYSKKYIDKLIRKAIFSKCSVLCIKLSEDVIQKYKLTKNKDIKSNNDEPVKKKPKVDVEGIDVSKMVSSREGESEKFKSSLKSKEEIESTRSEEILNDIVCEESTESETSLTNDLFGKIWVRDPKTMMDDSIYKFFVDNFFDKNPNYSTDSMVKSAPVNLSENRPTISVPSTEVYLNGKNVPNRRNLNEIEKLYNKYFNKSVEHTIMTIANILNIISIFNSYNKTQTNLSVMKKTDAMKLKERSNITILEAKLKKNVSAVISTFDELDFESSFKMFFLSILSVFRVLDQRKSQKNNIFKYVYALLWSSLINSKFDIPKVFLAFKSKVFYSDCINLLSLIEDSHDSNPEFRDCMPLFFISTVKTTKYFQGVINAMKSNSNANLGKLIDNASFKYDTNSNFKDTKGLKQYDRKTLIPATVKSHVNSDETIEHCMIQKYPDTKFQIPLPNGNTAVLPSIVTSHPFNSSFESYSSSLPKKVSSESSTFKLIASKNRVVPPSISNGSFGKVTISLSKTTKPTTTKATLMKCIPLIENKKPVLSNSIHRARANTIFFRNQQYQLVKTSAQLIAVENKTSTLVKPPSPISNCLVKNCKKSSTLLCSRCQLATYCSLICQKNDWYACHINNCEQLLAIKTNQP